MADDRDSLLREVDEELRREQMQKLWDRYNGLILGAAALVVLAVGGYKLLESRRINAAETAGTEFTAAENLSDDKKKDEAEKAFATIAQNGPAGYRGPCEAASCRRPDEGRQNPRSGGDV